MGERTWPSLLSALTRAQEISTDDAAWAMEEIMAGSATSAQIAGFALLLRAKRETPAELAGLAATMLSIAPAVPLSAAQRAEAVDIVGTGGDGAHTVNISTMSALVVAGAGVPVVKHGNRAASSLCGGADLLEHFGIPLDLGPADVLRCVEEAGIGFCFAGRFHPGLRHAGPTRRELGVPTAFNLLGPLTNPARPRAGAVGVADSRLALTVAGVFRDRGDSVLVVHGEDGLDEFTTAAPTTVHVVRGGAIHTTTVDAVDLGLARSAPGDLRGGDAPFNAAVARRLLAGETGPVRDAVLVNSAAALVAVAGVDAPPFADPDTDLRVALRAGIERAAAAIDSGAAAKVLNTWVAVANTR
ncbi:anthranilate phosphoribosyltransferase [Hamadaea flava]|uniref:Anthranilate phosphoribosyltransferase n=1 Tax=Hamadaea flava TaxID=1742688 RepID=A0ABV8LV78_9ACTN|nr:anthranilate phosphoribosyltransferase [Hamadaea flava]MCP2327847.1 anthranilate phosphoribosyltransferase [Hamadaea flava]